MTDNEISEYSTEEEENARENVSNEEQKNDVNSRKHFTYAQRKWSKQRGFDDEIPYEKEDNERKKRAFTKYKAKQKW